MLCKRDGARRWLDDKLGLHLQKCKGLGMMTHLHDGVTSCQATCAHECGIAFSREPRYESATHQRRGDLRLETDPFNPGMPCYTDTVCPSIASIQNKSLICDTGRGAAAAHHEQRKLNETPPELAQLGITLLPFAIESTPGGGALGPGVKRLARRFDDLFKALRGGRVDWADIPPSIQVQAQLSIERSRYAAYLAREAKAKSLALADETIIRAAESDLRAKLGAAQKLTSIIATDPDAIAPWLLPEERTLATTSPLCPEQEPEPEPPDPAPDIPQSQNPTHAASTESSLAVSPTFSTLASSSHHVLPTLPNAADSSSSQHQPRRRRSSSSARTDACLASLLALEEDLDSDGESMESVLDPAALAAMGESPDSDGESMESVLDAHGRDADAVQHGH